MPMNPELKKALRWMAPINFDGTFLGATVRSVETVAAGIGTMLLLHSVGIDCGGPIAVGTLILMGAQFATTERHEDTSRGDWRGRWNLKQQNRARAEEYHQEHHEEHGEVHHEEHH